MNRKITAEEVRKFSTENSVSLAVAKKALQLKQLLDEINQASSMEDIKLILRKIVVYMQWSG